METRIGVDAAGPVAVCRALQDVRLIQSRKTGDEVPDKGQRTATPAKLTTKEDAQKVYAPGTTPQQHSFSFLERYMKQN